MHHTFLQIHYFHLNLHPFNCCCCISISISISFDDDDGDDVPSHHLSSFDARHRGNDSTPTPLLPDELQPFELTIDRHSDLELNHYWHWISTLFLL